MADAPRSALAGHLAPGRHGAPERAAGTTLGEIAGAALVQIQGAPGGERLREGLAGFGLERAPQPLACTRGVEICLLWNGPGRYLAVGGRDGEHIAGRLAAALDADGACAVDVSHAYTRLRLAGPACVDVLAKGCALDLEELPAGGCAATVIGHFNVLLHRDAEAVFELYVSRSFAVSFWEWLLHAGAEHGVEIVAG